MEHILTTDLNAGHDFYVLASGSGTYTNQSLNIANPPRRDVATLPMAGFLVLAFVADNPGAWLMHCMFFCVSRPSFSSPSLSLSLSLLFSLSTSLSLTFFFAIGAREWAFDVAVKYILTFAFIKTGHIGWHVSMGFALQIVETPELARQSVTDVNLTENCEAWDEWDAVTGVLEIDSGV